jgi:hypothetical protein
VGVQMVLRGPHNNLVGIMTFNALDTRNALPTTQYIKTAKERAYWFLKPRFSGAAITYYELLFTTIPNEGGRSAVNSVFRSEQPMSIPHSSHLLCSSTQD